MKSIFKIPLFRKVPQIVRGFVIDGGHGPLSDDSGIGHHARDAKLRSNVIRKNHDRKR